MAGRSFHRISESDLAKSYIFTFVRNPFDRLVSCYVDKYVNEQVGEKDFRYFDGYLLGYLNNVPDFLSFVRKIVRVPPILADRHFKPQHCLLDACPRKVDFVGKFERIEEDFVTVSRRFECSSLRHLNSSAIKKDWRSYYCEESMGLAYRYYEQDFELFGYKEQVRELRRSLKIKGASPD